MTLQDYDSAVRVTVQTWAVRYGRTWRVWAVGDDGLGAETGPVHPTKLAAAAYALRLVERGDYR